MRPLSKFNYAFFSGSHHYQNCIWIWSFSQTFYWVHQTIQVLTVYPQPSSPKTSLKQSPTQPTPWMQKHICCSELQPSNTQPLHTMATSIHFSHKMFSHCPCLKGGFSTQSHWPAWEADCIAAGSALGTRPPGGKMPLRFIPAGAMAPVLHPNMGFEPLISDCAPL